MQPAWRGHVTATRRGCVEEPIAGEWRLDWRIRLPGGARVTAPIAGQTVRPEWCMMRSLLRDDAPVCDRKPQYAPV